MFSLTVLHLPWILPDLNLKSVHAASAHAHTLVSVSQPEVVSEVKSNSPSRFLSCAHSLKGKLTMIGLH